MNSFLRAHECLSSRERAHCVLLRQVFREIQSFFADSSHHERELGHDLNFSLHNVTMTK
jgi:hypothetical protein